MQDQGKRLLLAVGLALIFLLVWNMAFPHKDDDQKQQDQTQVTAPIQKPATPVIGSGSAAPTPVAPTPPTPPQPGPTAPTPAPTATPAPAITPPVEVVARPTEQTIQLPFENVVATFSSYCGGLKTWQLADPRYANDGTKGALLPEPAKMTVIGDDGTPHPVPAEQLKNMPDCGAFEVNFAQGSTYFVPHHAVWTGEQLSKTEVRYTFDSDPLQVVKTFTVIPDKYIVKMAVKVTVRPPAGTEAREQLALTVFAYQDPKGLKGGSSRVAARAWSSATMRNALIETNVESVLEWPRFEPSADSGEGPIMWTGFAHPYLLMGYAPHVGEGEHLEKHTSASDGTNGLPKGFMRTDILFASSAFKTGDAALTKEIVAYLGPKNYDDLKVADTAAGFTTGFEKTIDMGWFAFIARPLLWLLKAFYSVVGNWGIAIILLTFLVKGLTLYWTTKSMRSMKQMAALSPQMKALQGKYGSDKQRLQAETMALYKQHGVNPVAGCLPILLQMPIWLALYRMLSNAGELYQQPFIPGWINDLTATDPFYVLPAVLVVTMFIQARLQPSTADSTQQKFLQYGMPLMFGVMSFFFPAGLTLYIFTNTVLSALHSIYMNKFDKKYAEINAQMKKNKEAADKAAAGDANPKGKSNGAPTKAKPVIDVEASETSDETDADDAPAASAGATSGGGSNPARNRPRKKKRRR